MGAHERWDWQMSPIRPVAEASRERSVRYLPYYRTAERLPRVADVQTSVRS